MSVIINIPEITKVYPSNNCSNIPVNPPNINEKTIEKIILEMTARIAPIYTYL